MRPEVTISASHPQLGTLYWRHSKRTDRYHEADFIGFTTNPGLALRLPGDWGADSALARLHSDHLREAFNPRRKGSECWNAGAQATESHVGYHGTLRSLQERSGQTPDEFRNWMLLAEWKSSQAPEPALIPNVVMSTTHPTLGRLYWMMTGILENGDADYFGLTKKAGEALRLPRGWRTDQYLDDLHGRHIEQMLDPDNAGSDYFQYGPYEGDAFVLCEFDGRMGKLQEHSGQDVQAFVDWLRAAAWVGGDHSAYTCLRPPII